MAATVPSGDRPKLLRSAYLAPTEGLLKETRATGLFYLPGPILALLVVAVLDYSAFAAQYNWTPFPGLTNFWAGLGSIDGYTGPMFMVIFFGILTLLVLMWLLVRYLRWISTVYAVTTHRVIMQRGIFSRDFDEIPIPQVRGVDVHQSLGQRMLGYGTIRVSSEGGSSRLGNEDWEGIPRPFEFQRLIEGATQVIAGQVGGTARR
jgi:membrane protein YdbS with pleckstrin-like domain